MFFGLPLTPTAAIIVGPLMIGAAVLVLIGLGALYLSRGSGRRGLPQGARPSLGGGPTPQDSERDPRRDRSVEELRREAGSMLMEADQAIRSSEQEVLFAEASYGSDEVAVFRRDIEESKEHLSTAFRSQHSVDRDPPQDEDRVKDLFIEILDSCRRIHETLESHREEFESLRDLENRPEPAIEQLASAVDRVRGRIEAAEGRLPALEQDFTDSALQPLRQNLEETRRLLGIAESALTEARTAAGASDASAAVVAIHRGEESIDDAGEQVGSAEAADRRLGEAHRSLERELGQTEQDVAQAEATLEAGQAPELAGPVAAARSAASRIRRTLQESDRIDPLDLLSQLEEAHRELDEPLNSVRDMHARDRRARESLETELLTARNQVQSSMDFLRSKRMRVSPEAQARMSEAERCLREAVDLRERSPSRALDHAQQAKVLAVQAAQIAETVERERAEDNLTGMGMGMSMGAGRRDHGGRYYGEGGAADGFGRGYGGGFAGPSGGFGGPPGGLSFGYGRGPGMGRSHGRGRRRRGPFQ